MKWLILGGLLVAKNLSSASLPFLHHTTRPARFTYEDLPRSDRGTLLIVLPTQLIIGGGTDNPTTIGQAMMQGYLNGIEGGISLFIKSVIITLPTMLPFIAAKFSELYKRWRYGVRGDEDDQLAVDTKQLALKTKYLLAKMENIKALAQYQALEKIDKLRDQGLKVHDVTPH